MKGSEEKSYHVPHSSNIQQQMEKQTNTVNVLKLIGCYSYINSELFCAVCSKQSIN